MLLISCHSDTGFVRHSLRRDPDGLLYGELDNFAGVYAVMKAYFSGELDYDYIRVELTWGEEIDMSGARDIRETLNEHDMVIVVDVTGAPTRADFTVEKCRDAGVQKFLKETFSGLSYELFEDCPDPVSCSDEVDVYANKCRFSFFLGIPCTGGDYNLGKVYCREQSIESVSKAICRIAANFHSFCENSSIPVL